jgi:hypothetical protein
MNETSSLFLATLLLAVSGGAGYYIFTNSRKNHNNDDDSASENDPLEENLDEQELSDVEIDYAEPIKVKRKSPHKGVKSKRNVKKNSSGTKRRY